MLPNRRRLIVKTVFATLATLLAAGALGAVVAVYSGLYHIGATRQHFQPVHSLLEEGMTHSVRRHARDVVAPPLDNPAMVQRGAILFSTYCTACHGAPGVAPDAAGLGMQPVPGPLVDAAARWHPRELYWITRHGIKMSGMPAWEFRLPEQDLWAVVAFVELLPELSPADYAERTRQAQ